MAKTPTPQSQGVHNLSPDRLPVTSPLRSAVFSLERMGKSVLAYEAHRQADIGRREELNATTTIADDMAEYVKKVEAGNQVEGLVQDFDAHYQGKIETMANGMKGTAGHQQAFLFRARSAMRASRASLASMQIQREHKRALAEIGMNNEAALKLALSSQNQQGALEAYEMVRHGYEGAEGQLHLGTEERQLQEQLTLATIDDQLAKQMLDRRQFVRLEQAIQSDELLPHLNAKDRAKYLAGAKKGQQDVYAERRSLQIREDPLSLSTDELKEDMKQDRIRPKQLNSLLGERGRAAKKVIEKRDELRLGHDLVHNGGGDPGSEPHQKAVDAYVAYVVDQLPPEETFDAMDSKFLEWALNSGILPSVSESKIQATLNNMNADPAEKVRAAALVRALTLGETHIEQFSGPGTADLRQYAMDIDGFAGMNYPPAEAVQLAEKARAYRDKHIDDDRALYWSNAVNKLVPVREGAPAREGRPPTEDVVAFMAAKYDHKLQSQGRDLDDLIKKYGNLSGASLTRINDGAKSLYAATGNVEDAFLQAIRAELRITRISEWTGGGKKWMTYAPEMLADNLKLYHGGHDPETYYKHAQAEFVTDALRRVLIESGVPADQIDTRLNDPTWDEKYEGYLEAWGGTSSEEGAAFSVFGLFDMPNPLLHGFSAIAALSPLADPNWQDNVNKILNAVDWMTRPMESAAAWMQDDVAGSPKFTTSAKARIDVVPDAAFASALPEQMRQQPRYTIQAQIDESGRIYQLGTFEPKLEETELYQADRAAALATANTELDAVMPKMGWGTRLINSLGLPTQLASSDGKGWRTPFSGLIDEEHMEMADRDPGPEQPMLASELSDPEFSILNPKEGSILGAKATAKPKTPATKAPTNASREGVKVWSKPDIFNLVVNWANRLNLDSELAIAMVFQESGFNQFIKGRPIHRAPHNGASAEGLMQFMPTTAVGEGVENSFDPAQAVPAGLGYLKRLIDMFDGDVRLGLAAYNAGPGLIKRKGYVPKNGETDVYVDKILGYSTQQILEDLGLRYQAGILEEKEKA